MMATDPRRLGIFPQQRGAGIFGTLSGANMLLDILQKEKKQRGAGPLSRELKQTRRRRKRERVLNVKR